MLVSATRLVFERKILEYLSYNREAIETTKKTMGCMAILETLTYLGAFIIGYLIHTKSLPSALSFLKDRMQLGSALMITGITCLSIQSLLFNYIYQKSQE